MCLTNVCQSHQKGENGYPFPVTPFGASETYLNLRREAGRREPPSAWPLQALGNDNNHAGNDTNNNDNNDNDNNDNDTNLHNNNNTNSNNTDNNDNSTIG